LNAQAKEMGLLETVKAHRAETEKGERAAAAEFVYKAMRDLGLNAGEAYDPIAPEFKKRFPWVANLNFAPYGKFKFDVFNPDTLAKIRASVIGQCVEFREDPWVLGLAFVDLPVWDERRIAFYESLPTKAPGRQFLEQWRKAGKSDDAFLGEVADRLYTCLDAACHEGAPNHLFLGERFFLRKPPEEVIAAVGKHVDVYCTQALILSRHRPPEWKTFQPEGYQKEYRLTGGKPMIVIDWAAPFSLAKTFTHKNMKLEPEEAAAIRAATWLRDAMAESYMLGVFKCQLIGIHGADAQFEGRSRRTYLQDNGTPWPNRTHITRQAHAAALRAGYQAAMSK